MAKATGAAQWQMPSLNGKGKEIPYIDCADGVLKFSPGGKAKFAISQFQYVPIGKGGYRDERMEDWFSPDEDALIRLARETTSKTFGSSMSAKDKGKAVRACILLGYRSHYEFELMKKAAQVSAPNTPASVISMKVVSHFWAVFEYKLKQFKSKRPGIDVFTGRLRRSHQC